MKNAKTIRSLFSLPGFTANAKLKGVFGDRYSRVISLRRRKKQPSVLVVGIGVRPDTIVKYYECVIYPSRVGAFILSLNVGGLSARRVYRCM